MHDEKARLLEALRASGEEFLAAIAGLDDAALASGRYENGWTAREILAHVAAIEWTYPRLVELAASPAASSQTRSSSARDGIEGYNGRQVAKRAGMPAAELIAEFRRNREATIAAVEAADGALLGRKIRSAGGREGTLAKVYREVAVDHVRGHLRDIVGN